MFGRLGLQRDYIHIYPNFFLSLEKPQQHYELFTMNMGILATSMKI